MENLEYLGILHDRDSFSKDELNNAMNASGVPLSEAAFKARLQKLIDSGSIRFGFDGYGVFSVEESGVCRCRYEYDYSKWAVDIADRIIKEHPFLDFTIFEMAQLDEFVHYQPIHCMIFVCVEGKMGDFVFDTLNKVYPGKVLLNPDVYDKKSRCWSPSMVVINRLTAGAPKCKTLPWAVTLEKLLVDIMSNPMIRISVSESTCSSIYTEAFDRYFINESSLFRYARRRGVEKRIMQFIRDSTDIQLRTRSI